MSFAKITVMGNLGKDPQLTHSDKGTAICNFSVATNEREKRRGEQVDITTWYDVTLFGSQAEVAAKYLKKGRKVYVEGRFRPEEWTDREGKQRLTNKIKGTDMQLVDPPDGAPQEHTRQAAPAQPQSNGDGAPAGGGDIEDDEIPF